MNFQSGLNNLTTYSHLLNEDRWFFLVGLLIFSLIFTLWIAYIRFYNNKRIEKLKSELQQMQNEFKAVKNRTRSNLQMFRNVVDGFEDILGKMRIAIEEEERKLDSFPVEGTPTSNPNFILKKEDK